MRPSDSPRAKAQAGPTATVALHNLVERDQFGDLGRPLPPSLDTAARAYRKIYLGYEPADARYLSNHRGHLMFLRPEEQAICTADLIRATTFTAPRGELRERIRELGRAGLRPRRPHRPPRISGDAGGMVRRVRGRVTARGVRGGADPPASGTARLLGDQAIADLVAGMVDG